MANAGDQQLNGRSKRDHGDGGEPIKTATRLDRTLTVLGHRSRRRILSQISEYDSTERDEFPVADLPSAGVDETQWAVELCHIHLPKLAEAGYIEWDKTSRTIRCGPEFDEIEPLVTVLREHPTEFPDE
jgi:hypothetical protein